MENIGRDVKGKGGEEEGRDFRKIAGREREGWGRPVKAALTLMQWVFLEPSYQPRAGAAVGSLRCRWSDLQCTPSTK